MNIYKNNSRFKLYLSLAGLLIVFGSLIYTNQMIRLIEEKENDKMRLYASTLKQINQADLDDDLTFYLDILNSEKTIPSIVIDAGGKITQFNNLNEEKSKNSSYLERKLKKMKNHYKPIQINQASGSPHLLYYNSSYLIQLLKWYPFIQFTMITLFLTLAYYLFSQARKSEQDQVWVGMSKETAHQLGTPIFSMVGWLEYLKMSEDESVLSIVPEMEQDIERLKLITDRFSKIGSVPNLESHKLVPILNETIEYMKRRSPRKVKYESYYPQNAISVAIYPPLFNWVLENLIRNSLDAMDAKGTITVQLHTQQDKAIIDVKDTGKGITGNNKNIVFRPGFSTKKRGWGLGLSLAKRIIEEYHHGKIYVLESTKDVGTTFRIELDTQTETN